MPSMDPTLSNTQTRSPDHAGAFQARPPRQRTCLNGKLAYGDGIFAPDGALSLDCAIRDISESGAKIVLAKRQPIPVNLYLIVVKFAVAYHASVVWLNYPARGLKFSEKYDLTAPLPVDLRFLHRLWAELGARNGVLEPFGE
jgi:hypothetical protein